MRQQLAKSPNDEAMKKDYREFVADKAQQELTIFQEAAENYPTDMTLKFQVAQRLYLLGRFDEAIPAFQQSRSDPKNRTDATLFLGRAFLDAQYVDEAVDTLRVLIEEYPLKGDPKSVEMTYWYARALEAHNQNQLAIKNYSQVAQWDFNYRDVQTRIKRLRAAAAAG